MPEVFLPLASPGSYSTRVINEATGEVAWGGDAEIPHTVYTTSTDSDDSYILARNAEDGSEIWRNNENYDPTWPDVPLSLQATPDDSMVIVGSDKNWLDAHQSGDGTHVWNNRAAGTNIISVEVGPAGEFVYFGDLDDFMKARVDDASNVFKVTPGASSGRVTGISAHPSGDSLGLALGDGDGVKRVSAADGSETWSNFGGTDGDWYNDVVVDLAGDVLYAARGNTMAMSGSIVQAEAYDYATGDRLWTATPFTEERIRAIALAPAGDKLFAVARGTVLYCLDTSDGATLWTRDKGHYMNSLAIAPDGSRLYAGGGYQGYDLKALDPSNGDDIWVTSHYTDVIDDVAVKREY